MKLKFNIPSSWNDLSTNQLKRVAKVLFSNKPAFYVDYQIFKILANIRWYKFMSRRKLKTLFSVLRLEDIKATYSFIYQKQDLTKFIPEIQVKGKTYYAPFDRLANLSIFEFAVCEDLFIEYQKKAQSPEHNFGFAYLLLLTAVLYTPSERKRPTFQREDLKFLSHEFKGVNKSIVLATALSYKGCKSNIVSLPRYANIFPKPVTKTEPSLENMFAKQTSSGLGKLILEMSNQEFGNYEKTRNTNLYTFLDLFSQKKRDHANAKRNAQKRK